MHSRNVCSRAALVAGVLALVLAAPLAAQSKGYTLDDILGLLRRHVASTRVLALAKTSCVTFEVTDDVATRVKRAGGTQALVDGLKQVCNPNTPVADSATKIASGAVPIPKATEPPPPPPPPVDTNITVRLRAAVVGSDLTVRALPGDQADDLPLTGGQAHIFASGMLLGVQVATFNTGAGDRADVAATCQSGRNGLHHFLRRTAF